jgi:gluconate 2-dehydrogenase gamma chain
MIDESEEKKPACDSPEDQADVETRRDFVSRRTFLKASILAAATGTGLVATACAPAPPQTITSPPLHPLEDKYPYVPPAPTATPNPSMLRFFTPDEAKLVDAITARLIPGTPEDPGAHEAGVVTYIDNLLPFNDGYDEPTYTQPPFVKTYEGPLPPEAATANPKQVVYVEKKESPRYGYQSKQTPQEQYRKGLESVDKFAQAKFGSKFVALSDAQKDELLKAMQEDQATGFDEPKAPSFFKLLLKHTGEGMFADPAYGGNRNLVGWKLVGYPGAHRAYTEFDLHDEKFDVAPQTLKQLPPFHPGEHNMNGAILPVQSEDKYPNQPPGSNMLQQILRWFGISRSGD